MGAALRRNPRSISYPSLLLGPASLEPRPVSVFQDDLDVLDGVEVLPRSVPYSENEVAIGGSPLELQGLVVLEQRLVRARQGIRHVSLGRQSTGTFDSSGEELRFEVPPLKVAYEVRSVVNEGIG